MTRAVAAGEMGPPRPSAPIGRSFASVVVDLLHSRLRLDRGRRVVDLWSAPKNRADHEYGAPVVLVSGATVVRPVAPAGIAGAQQTRWSWRSRG